MQSADKVAVDKQVVDTFAAIADAGMIGVDMNQIDDNLLIADKKTVDIVAVDMFASDDTIVPAGTATV